MTTATYPPAQLHSQHPHSQHGQQSHSEQPQPQPPPHPQHVPDQHQPLSGRRLLDPPLDPQSSPPQLAGAKHDSRGLPPPLTLPPSPQHHSGLGGASDSQPLQAPQPPQQSVSAPASLASLHPPVELTPSSSSASSHSSHSPTAAAWEQSAAPSAGPVPASASAAGSPYAFRGAPVPAYPPPPVHYGRPLPPFYPPVAYLPPVAAAYPAQLPPPPPSAPVAAAASPSSASSPPSQHSPPMSYHHLQQPPQQPQPQQQTQGGQAAQQASNARHAYPPPPTAHHQANAAYSGFYPPPFQQANLPMVNSGYGHNQAAAAHAHMVKQQSHSSQQPPFSPSSLHQLLNSSPGQQAQQQAQQHGQQANHLSTHINVNLNPSAFPAQSAHQQTPTLSSDLLYVNQRYHDLVYKLALHMKKLDEHHHHQHPVLIEDILRAIREEVAIYHAQQLNRLSAIKPEHLLSSPLSSSLSTLSSLSGAYMSSAASMQQTDRLFCKPSRLISQFNKKPFKLLMVQIQRQYTSSKKELDLMKDKDKEKLIAIRVRLMGAPLRGHVYFVAKDLCQLIHSRKGNVAKSVSQFNENEKARMPVLCPRSNGTLSTHSLTVLTIDGIKRLLTASRSPLAPHLLKWLLGQVELIVEQGERGDEKVGETTTVTFPKVERKGDVEVKEGGDNEQEVEVMLDSDEEGGHEEGGGAEADHEE